MNQPWIYMCSPSWSPPPPPSSAHPSGSSQCTSPEHLSHASNLGWWSVSHLVIYMFQCYSLRLSHPRLLPQTPTNKIKWKKNLLLYLLFSCSVMSDSATSWITAHQASLSFTTSWSLVKLMSIESVMPSNCLISCRSLLLLPSIFPSIRVFSSELALHIK